MSVNLSMRQFNDDGPAREIETVLRETGMDPQLLELEITESMVMHNAERAVADAARDQGARRPARDRRLRHRLFVARASASASRSTR